jgi:hypothetical protein
MITICFALEIAVDDTVEEEITPVETKVDDQHVKSNRASVRGYGGVNTNTNPADEALIYTSRPRSISRVMGSSGSPRYCFVHNDYWII